MLCLLTSKCIVPCHNSSHLRIQETCIHLESASDVIQTPTSIFVCVAGNQPMSTEATQEILEQCSTFRFEWGGGGVIPQVPSAVYRLASPSPPAPLQQMITDRRY